jgi:hypothetical protein
MSIALSKEEIVECLIQAGLSAEDRQKAIREIEAAEMEKKAEKDNKPKRKKKLNIVVRTDDPSIVETVSAGWIIESPEEIPVEQLEDRMVTGAARHNDNAKSRGKVFRWLEFFNFAKPKTLKDEDVLVGIKTKEAVEIVWLKSDTIPFK